MELSLWGSCEEASASATGGALEAEEGVWRDDARRFAALLRARDAPSTEDVERLSAALERQVEALCDVRGGAAAAIALGRCGMHTHMLAMMGHAACADARDQTCKLVLGASLCYRPA